MADRKVMAPRAYYGQPYKVGRPRQIGIHSLEAPAIEGIAYSLATGWFQTAPNKVSIHAIADPKEVIDMVTLDYVAWHIGGGNPFCLGLELTGYAGPHRGRGPWTPEEWIAPKSLAALKNGARKVAEWAHRYNISIRWLSLAQIAAGEDGLLSHNDARLVYGGTTHTDPGPNFPYALFLKLCQQYAGELVRPAPNPNPQSEGPQTGGAEPEDDVKIFCVQGPEGKVYRTSDFVTLTHIPSMDALNVALDIWNNTRIDGQQAMQPYLLVGYEWVPFRSSDQLKAENVQNNVFQFGTVVES